MKKKHNYQLQLLFGLSRRKKLTDRKLAEILGVHYNSVSGWRTGKSNPSALAKIRVKEFLIKNL